jgi:hypothetical protein
MKMVSETTSKVFGDVKVGQAAEIDLGGGTWIRVVKVDAFYARREDGQVIGVSFWTKTR